jgi:hypothetical protein
LIWVDVLRVRRVGFGLGVEPSPRAPRASAAPLCRHSTTFQHVPTEYSRSINHVIDLPRADRVHPPATLFEPPVWPDIVVTPAWHAFGRHHPTFPPSVLPAPSSILDIHLSSHHLLHLNTPRRIPPRPLPSTLNMAPAAPRASSPGMGGSREESPRC